MPRTKSTTVAGVYGRQKDRYMELIHLFPLRPLASEEDLDEAIAVIDSLLDQPKRTKPENDYLEVLGDIVHAYEEEHDPETPVPDSAMLQSFIEDHGLTQQQVAKGAGIAVSTVSEVLSGKRKLNRKQIGKLAKFFNVSPAVFDFSG
jgi:HTH-type transcriptional regulator / antitoxin HigA